MGRVAGITSTGELLVAMADSVASFRSGLTRAGECLMIVVFDVGNSEITIGIFDGEELVSHWRLTTAAPRTADELALLIRSITGRDDCDADEERNGSAICSVVPAITPMLAEACEMCFGKKPVMIDARAKLPIKLDVEEPFTVGADRIANTLAASRIHKKDAIVVDLGTATTYDCITADGTFLGGVIQPGRDDLGRHPVPADGAAAGDRHRPAEAGDCPPDRRMHSGRVSFTERWTRSMGSSAASRRNGRARTPRSCSRPGGWPSRSSRIRRSSSWLTRS